jgi:hypothetical protein
MATPEENMQAALERAEKFRSAGNLERAAVWEASADRYKRIIDAKERIAQASKNLDTIKENLKKAQDGSDGVTSGPNKGWYQIVTSRPSAACPGGHERVRITYMNGAETNVESLGCIDSSPAGDSGGSKERTLSTPPVDVKATPPTPPPPPPPPPPVRTAPIDTVLFEDSGLPIEIMTDLIFEDIGGQELISIVRNDTINGQQLIYQPIKNISLIQQQYNPNNIIALQSTSDKYFSNFYIKLDNRVPIVGNGQNGNNVYFDLSSGSIIIDTINMESDEQVEAEFLINGTIYEAEL